MALALFSSYGIDCNRMMNLSLRVRLFWVKMISGNHFPPNPHVWLQRKMKFSENSFSVDQYLLLWLENDFTLSFSLQIISGEREKEKREPRSERERGRRDFAGDRTTRQLTSALVGRSHRSRLRSRLHRTISSSPPPSDLNLTEFDEFFCWVLFLLWMSVELIHYLHVYSWGSVWKIGHVKHFL